LTIASQRGKIKNMMTIENFRRNCKFAMIALGKQQKAVAAKCGITPVCVNRILQGVSVPTLRTALLLSQELGIGIDELCGCQDAFRDRIEARKQAQNAPGENS
jgi:transcriptional regulator with XRE-family HTH domain